MDAGFRTGNSTDHANGHATYYAVRFDFVLLDITSLNGDDIIIFRKHTCSICVAVQDLVVPTY